MWIPGMFSRRPAPLPTSKGMLSLPTIDRQLNGRSAGQWDPPSIAHCQSLPRVTVALVTKNEPSTDAKSTGCRDCRSRDRLPRIFIPKAPLPLPVKSLHDPAKVSLG